MRKFSNKFSVIISVTFLFAITLFTVPLAASACVLDIDCGLDQTCDLDSGDCVDVAEPTGCTGDHDCGTGEECNQETGVCFTADATGCVSDNDCPDGEVCNASTEVCETDSSTTSEDVAVTPSEAVEYSDTIKYETVPQSTYFAELQANGITFAYVSPKCQDTGECTLEDIMQVFVNIANFILGIVGSLTLIITIYGGFLWLTSQGSSEKIEQGKTAMTGSVIGMLIVFGAFAGINLLTGVLRNGTAGQTNKCELVSPASGGKAGTGYACLKTTGLDTTTDYTCVDNLCPGDDTIKCCIKKDATSN